jgi:YggT family protein
VDKISRNLNLGDAIVGAALIDALRYIIYVALDMYWYVLLISVILSWLINFDVVNPRRLVSVIDDVSQRLLEPLLQPIRRLVPPMAGLDLAPMVLMFAILFLQRFISHI